MIKFFFLHKKNINHTFHHRVELSLVVHLDLKALCSHHEVD